MSDSHQVDLPIQLESLIFVVRGRRVMLSTHLAELYGEQPKVLVQAVKRNVERFPEDFMFQLTGEELKILKSQYVTLTLRTPRATPYAFTEQDVAMLSSVLRSHRDVAVNIEIMRAFVRLRSLLAGNDELSRKLEELEQKRDERFKIVLDAVRQLMSPPMPKQRQIGIRQTHDDEH